MRGEHPYTRTLPYTRAGSPPHARGTLYLYRSRVKNGRITPACAGNTQSLRAPARWEWDHPRMRGEHLSAALQSATEPGSPPHARGTPCRFTAFTRSSRITPACAGNTLDFPGFEPFAEDHPRMRGEHFEAACRALLYLGSPPHARGTLCSALLCSKDCRITPACAGNTNFRHRMDFWRWDHPRMRGEHFAIKTPFFNKAGSPPHARGTRSGDFKNDYGFRITPACAGNTDEEIERAIQN